MLSVASKIMNLLAAVTEKCKGWAAVRARASFLCESLGSVLFPLSASSLSFPHLGMATRNSRGCVL